MDITNIKDANVSYTAPVNWDQKQDNVECAPIQARHRNLPEIFDKVVEVAWSASPNDIEKLMSGGYIVLRMVGGLCPHSLYVELPE